MPEREKVLAVVREWMVKAENDLTTAAHTLELGDDCPTDTVCFHTQQCVASTSIWQSPTSWFASCTNGLILHATT